MNGRSVSELLGELHPDPWRSDVGFAPEIAQANTQLFKPGITEVEASQVLNDWLQKYQPCLFGRLGPNSVDSRRLCGTQKRIRDSGNLSHHRAWSSRRAHETACTEVLFSIPARAHRNRPDLP